MKRKITTLFLALTMVLSCIVAVHAADTDTVTINVSDPPQAGIIDIPLIVKHYEDGHKSTLPLSGAVFEVKHYANYNASGNPIHTWYFETEDLNPSAPLDADGKYGISGSNPKLASGYTSSPLIPYGNLAHVWPLGSYTISEYKAPIGYQKNEEVRKFTVEYNEAKDKFGADIYALTGSLKKPWLQSTERDIHEPKNHSMNIAVYKADEDNNELSPEGNASLAGIKFAVVLRSADEYVYRDAPEKLMKKGQVVEILTTDENGYAITKPSTADTDASIKPYNLRYGTYEVVELRADSKVKVGDYYDSNDVDKGTSRYANSSYLFKAQTQTKDCFTDKTTFTYGPYTVEPGNVAGFKNRVVRGGVHVYKKDVETGKYTPEGDASLAGIRFAIVSRSTNKVKVDGTNRTNGQVVKIITTNEDGEAWTSNETLPYGDYSIYELRADATIAVGDTYNGSNKLGSSIYANNSGIAGSAENNHGSMLWADQHENFTITYEHEMVGEGTRRYESEMQTGEEKFIQNDTRTHYENRVVRGGFEAYKVDKETMISYPLDGASLAGIEFTLKNASKREVLVNGKLYQPGDVIPDAKGTKNNAGAYVWITNKEGRIFSDDQYLPYGTYTLQETKTNDSYHLTDGKPHEFHIRIEKQIVGKDDDNLIRTKAEANALISKWVGSTNFPQANLVFPDQVKRGPFSFQKKDENGDLMKNIPWKVTNTRTNEVHYIMTDANGNFNSDMVPHSMNTNGYDETLKQYEVDGDPIPASVLQELATKFGNGTAQYNVGMWFGWSQDVDVNGEQHVTIAPVNDELGAYPYGWYTLEEMRCDANVGKELIKDEFYVYSDDGAPLGTLDNEPVDLKTHAKDTLTRNDIGKIHAKDNINDQVDYYGLQTDKNYHLYLELHYAKGEEGHKVDGGIIKDKNNKEVKSDVKIEHPKTRDGYTDLDLPLDSRKLYAEGELLKGPDTVIFAYLYEIKEDGTEKFVDAAIDPNDKNETIHYPWIGTTLTDEKTKIRMGFARKNMVVNDRIEYRNFPIGTKYEFEGYLVDKATGKPAVDADGKPIESTVSQRIQEKDGFVNMRFEFNGTGMDGMTLVAFEAVDGGDVSIEHFDIDDEAQNFHIPKISTQAKDKDTQDDVGKVVGTFVDTVKYENLVPGYEYTMYCDLMFKDTNKSSGQKGSKSFTAQPLASDPNRSDGSITIEVPLELTKAELEGRDLVAFEELKIKPKQDDKIVPEEWLKQLPEKEELLAEHKDINDASQTVNYPKIRTLAVDKFTEDHVGTVIGSNEVLDTVEYWNLVEGRDYTIKGTLYDVDGSLLATASPLTFTATAEDVTHGKKTIRFAIDTSQLDGHTVVVYEKLFHNDVEVTQHEENNDETQRVHYPWMNTTAIDSETRDHVGTILGRLINSFRRLTGENVEDKVYQKVIDKVDYKNTISTEEYTLVGTLMNKETNQPILGDDGKPVTSSATLKAGHPVDGSVDIEFSVDSSKLTNVTIVCYEKMFHKNPNTKEDIEVNRHENIKDEDQSVHDVEIKTTAIDKHTGDHVGDATKATTIEDTVEMKNLVSGMEYELVGTPYVKETGQKLTKADGSEYPPVRKKFTPAGGSDTNKRVDMSQVLTFDVNGLDLQDKTIVIFEDLYHNGVRITTHSNIDDEDQSVHYPKVLTTAKDSKTKDHVGTVSGTETVIDVVELKNLIPGQKYIVSGKLMIHGTTNPLLDKNGNEITREKEITATERNMSVELVFDNLDTTIFRGKTTVVFEKLYHPYKNVDTRVEVANHEEPNDEEQSVHWPDLRTHAIDKDSGGHVGSIRETTTVKDKVTLKNLIPGQDYTIRGVLHYKEDAKDTNGNVIHKKGDVVQMNGMDVTAEKRITAEKADEEHVLEFKVDSTLLEGATVVAFEKLYHPENNTGTLVEVVQHEDIEDEEQSVHYPRIGTVASDGLTADHVGATEQNKINDKVFFENFIIGQKYRIKGVLMDKDTGEPIKINGQEVTADSGWFVADKTGSGTDNPVIITFDIDASQLDGKTVVAFEKLFTPHEAEWTDTDDEPIVEVELTNHEDINDEDQSVHYPKVTTNARDNDTSDHVGKVSANEEDLAQVKDNVTLENLIPGQKYSVVGRLMKHGTTQPVLDKDGKEILAHKEFVASSSTMTFDMEFDKYDSSIVRGQTTVAFEYLYHPNPETDVDVEVATHEEPNDEAQSVHYPKIRTVAVDTETGDHVGSIFGRLINAFRRALGEDVPDEKLAGIRDTVIYENLIAGQTYTVEGRLANKATGELIKDSEGKEIVASTTFTPSTADGEVEVMFDVDTSFLQNTIIVCYEKLFHNDVEVDRHEDLEDDDQSVYEVEVTTDAKDVNTENHIGMASGETKIVDAVTMKGLRKDAEYTINGTLYDKETEKPLLDGAGQPYTATTTFTATDYEMVVDLTFVVDGKALEGTTAVAFEELWHNDKKIAVHSDINDEAQSIHFPKIRTILTSDIDKVHVALENEALTVTDVVKYENLIADKECTIKGVLMDKATGQPVMQDGQPVTSEIKFTPTEPNGTVELPFTVQAMPDSTVVAFEELWYPVEKQPVPPAEGEPVVEPVEPTVEEVLIAYHKDLTDEDQSVHIPEIWTEAELKNKVVLDNVTYRNLIPGKYVAKGWLVNQKNGKKLKESDGEKEFTIDEFTPEGSVLVKLPVNGYEKLGGYKLTAFEELYYVSVDENGNEVETLVAEHKDVEDEAQTVQIPKIKTGDDYKIYLEGSIFILAALLYFAIRKIKTHNR